MFFHPSAWIQRSVLLFSFQCVWPLDTNIINEGFSDSNKYWRYLALKKAKKKEKKKEQKNSQSSVNNESIQNSSSCRDESDVQGIMQSYKTVFAVANGVVI